jgi:hypothetical protein
MSKRNKGSRLAQRHGAECFYCGSTSKKLHYAPEGMGQSIRDMREILLCTDCEEMNAGGDGL